MSPARLREACRRADVEASDVVGLLACELIEPEDDHAAPHALCQASAAIDLLRPASPACWRSVEPERLACFELGLQLIKRPITRPKPLCSSYAGNWVTV